MVVRLWKPLKGIVKIYGMSRLGVVCGIVGCLIAMMFLGIMWSVGGAIPGYFVGDYLSKVLHDGQAQRFMRWYFGIFENRKGPISSNRLFF